jgi:hypothetical protein
MKVRPINDPDRLIELQEGLDEILARAAAKLNEAGFSTKEVLEALHEIVMNRWRAYDEDPDPADDSE